MKTLKRKTVILVAVIVIVLVIGVVVFIGLLMSNNFDKDVYNHPTEKYLISNYTSSPLDKDDKLAFEKEIRETALKKSIEEIDEVNSCDISIEDGSKTMVEASIILNSGEELSADRQAAIKKLIKNSINGVNDENITLIISKDE